MSNIQFDEGYQSNNNSYSSDSKGMANWLVNKGIVKNKKTAEIVLLVAAIAFFALSLYFFSN